MRQENGKYQNTPNIIKLSILRLMLELFGFIIPALMKYKIILKNIK